MGLSRPERFVSAGGRLLLKLKATNESGDISIDNPFQDFQIFGSGTVT